MKLGLGTVQFGMDYGISNLAGQTSAEEVAEILASAVNNGIRVIDTAALYGSSEEVLGRALPAGHRFLLVTKTVRFDTGRITPKEVTLLEQGFARSLQRLGRSSLYALLIHNACDLLAENGHLLMESLDRLKQSGMVTKIGVSVYGAEQIDRVLGRFAIDMIQLPVNILDQRLLRGGQLASLRRAGVEIHARSPLLQGLLLMEPGLLPPHFDPVKAHLTRYRHWLSLRGMNQVQAALGFVTGLHHVDRVICGVSDHKQLEELCSAAAPLCSSDFEEFALDDDAILNPARWPR